MQYHERNRQQQGVVSILTVLMFSILLGVLLTGFTRIVLQEQQDTLQDDLSKGAYNSAQAGIEDAKRAIQYCSTNPPNVPGKDCSNLYNATCPGFNSVKNGVGAFDGIGIKAPSDASGSTVGDAAVNQRYTCVLISPSTDIVTTLGASDTTNNSALYKLEGAGGAAFDTVQISWHSLSEGAPVLPSTATVSNISRGNVRQPDWIDSTYPALLRATLIATDPTMTAGGQPKQSFLYPTNGLGSSPTTVNYSTLTNSTFVNCAASPALSASYKCSQKITMNVAEQQRFIMFQPFYKGTTVSVSLFNGVSQVAVAEQTTIDATGAANNVFRRVEARVAPGKPLATSTALDVGNSICKNFFVSIDTFENPDCN